jgi:hypothetical protein
LPRLPGRALNQESDQVGKHTHLKRRRAKTKLPDKNRLADIAGTPKLA